MAQYLMSVHSYDAEGGVPDVPTEELNERFAATGVFNDQLMAEGSWVFAGGLHPPTSATTVDATKGETLITDGPFAETKEHLGGFWVVDVPDLDAALALATRASTA